MAKKRKKRKLKKSIVKKIRVVFFFLIAGMLSFFLLHYRSKEGVSKEPSIGNIGLMEKSNQILKVIKKPESYPDVILKMLYRNPDMLTYVLDYPEKVGKVYSDTIGEIKKGEVPLLLQYDQRWGYGMYGDDTIAVGGCAPTSLSMVIAYYTNNSSITPSVVADFSYKNGYYVSGSGSSWLLLSEGASNFGIVGRTIPLVKSTIFRYLEEGKPIIASMGPGDFTRTGHFIVFTGIKDGKIKVNDPNSRKNSEQLWEYEKIESQIKNLWVYEKKS